VGQIASYPVRSEFLKKGDEKMNEFYHAFRLSFNWWFVVAPLNGLMMVFLGSMRYVLNEKTMKILRRGNGFDVLVKIVATVLDIALIVMIFQESILGLFQWLVNHVDGDPIWAIIVLPLVLVAIYVGFYWMFCMLAKIGEWTKHGYLIDLKREQRDAKRQHRREMEIITLEPEIEKVEAEVVDFGWQP